MRSPVIPLLCLALQMMGSPALGQEESTGQLVGRLHGIPAIVKDNFDTHDLPTTAGSLTLKGSTPPDDAFTDPSNPGRGRHRPGQSQHGGIRLLALRNRRVSPPRLHPKPIRTNRVTAGSSGGTAAAVAASFGAVGLGTDTGNSIRDPASHQALVGIRSTMGLTSRDGIVPLYRDRDIGGPMARTVADAVAVPDVIAGYDLSAPVRSLDEILERGDYHPSIEVRLQYVQEYQGPPDEDRTCREADTLPVGLQILGDA